MQQGIRTATSSSAATTRWRRRSSKSWRSAGARLSGSSTIRGRRHRGRPRRSGISRAAAVVCAGNDDAMNLEIALLARKANPNMRVVGAAGQRSAARGGGRRSSVLARSSTSPNWRRRRSSRHALAHTAHPVRGGRNQIPRVQAAEAPYDATLREIYADWRRWR